MTNDDESQPTLPGLSLDPEGGAPSSPLREAVKVTLDALRADGLLEPRHAAMAQLALELADSVTKGNRSGRASAAAMAAAQLLATLLALPMPASATELEKFHEFIDSLKDDL